MANRTRLIGRAAVAAFLAMALGLFAGSALADSPPQSLGFEAMTVPGETGAWTLEARLTDAENRPVSGETVQFLLGVDFLGVRQVVVASALTDAGGTAKVTYRPTSSDEQTLVARATGSGATSVPVDLGVTGVPPALPSESDSLAFIAALAGPAAVVLALVVWATLAGVLLSVIRVVVRPRRRVERVLALEGETAGTRSPDAIHPRQTPAARRSE